MAKAFWQLLGLAAMALVLLVGIKSCIVDTWPFPTTPTTYAIDGEDGRSMAFIFLPSRELLIAYGDPANEAVEIVLDEIFGTLGTRYLGNVWNVSEEGSLFGLRRFPSGVRPVRLDMTVIEKHRSGRGESAFPRVGERTQALILDARDSLRFEGMWLKKVATDSAFLLAAMKAVGR